MQQGFSKAIAESLLFLAIKRQIYPNISTCTFLLHLHTMLVLPFVKVESKECTILWLDSFIQVKYYNYWIVEQIALFDSNYDLGDIVFLR